MLEAFRNRAVRVSLLLMLLLGSAAVLLAQTPTAQITGRVTDATDAVIPGAEVSVRNTGTGTTRQTVANDTGNYTIPLLDPGSYEVTVTQDGFRPISQRGLTLNVGQAARIDFVMEVGAVTETIEITAAAPLVDSERSALGSVVENRSVVNLPLNGRETTTLALLVAGVVPGPNTGGTSGRNPAVLFINGGRGNTSDILADGISLTMPEFNPSLQVPLVPQVDVIQEFKVHTNSLAAEFGRSGGGILDFVYKSGTNQYHGTVFEFLRNSKLDANDFFGNAQGEKLGGFSRSQFGGTIGGPIIRDRLFFFGSYEGNRSATQGSSTLTVPTAAERIGDFSQTRRNSGGSCQAVNIYDPYTTTAAPGGGFVREQYANNMIPQSALDPVAARTVTYYPIANVAGNPCTGAQNFFSSGSSRGVTDQPAIRVDYNPGSNDRLFVRWDRRMSRGTGRDAYGTKGRTNNPKANAESFGESAAISYVRTLSPTWLGEFRTGLARNRSASAGTGAGENEAGDDFDMRSALGWTGAAGNFIDQLDAPLAFPRISPTGYSQLGTGQQAWNKGGGTSIQFAGTMTKISGAHTIKFGTDYRVLQHYGPNAFFASGAYDFTPAFTQGPNPTRAGTLVGNGLASLLSGLGTGRAQTNPRLLVSNHYLAMFIQDDWRVTPKLVLNLGVRYDREDGRSERHDRLSYFDFDSPSPLAAMVPSLPNLHGGLAFVGVDGNPHQQFDTDGNNFGPRAGLAYSIREDTVLRIGYGIMYDPFIGRAVSSGAGYLGFNTPTTWVSSLDGITPFRSFRDPFPGGLIPSPGSSLGLMTLVGEAIGSDGSAGRDGAFDRQNVVGYIQQWNVTIQKGLPGNMSLELGYTGNKGTKLADGGGFQLNQLTPAQMALGNQLLQSVPNPFFGVIQDGPLKEATTTVGQLLREYPQFTNVINYRPSAASSIYHAFQLQLSKRFSQDLQFVVAYTNGKAIDDSSNAVDFRGDLGGSGRHQNVYDRGADRSLSLNDVAQRLAINYVWELPFGRGKKFGAGWGRLTDALLGGWQLNGIVTFQSGQPLIIENSSNNAGAFSDNQRPNISGDPTLPSNRETDEKLARWFDTSVFSQPAAFTFGNAPRVLSTRSDGINETDMSLFKNFRMWEGVQLQFRAEFFNATNTPRWGLPNQSFGSGNFGRVTSTRGSARQTQFGLKILF